MKIELSKSSAIALAKAILQITDLKDVSNVEINKTLIDGDYEKELNAKIIFEPNWFPSNRPGIHCGKVKLLIEKKEKDGE